MYPKIASSAPVVGNISRTPGMILLAHDVQKIVSALAKQLKRQHASPLGKNDSMQFKEGPTGPADRLG